MKKRINDFLDFIFNCKKGSLKYITYGYQEDYREKENFDLGYVPFPIIKFEELVNIIPLTNPNNRPGDLKESTEYICVHDTASGAPSAGAIAHKNWLESMANNVDSKTCVSWHFTVDDKYIIQHLPIDEVAYHAGDGTGTKLQFINTHIKAKEPIEVTKSNDGYFVVNGKKTDVMLPLDNEGNVAINAKFPALGINYIINKDGEVELSNTYYNKSYNCISNRGGNLNSVGIETCVNYGSNYTKTMRINANLVARLLDNYKLDTSRVKQHNSFSGKDCPMTIRHSNRWQEFIDLVNINREYNILKEDYNFEFKSLTPENLNDEGEVIKLEKGLLVRYLVKVTNKLTNEEVLTKEYQYRLDE